MEGVNVPHKMGTESSTACEKSDGLARSSGTLGASFAVSVASKSVSGASSASASSADIEQS